VKRLSVILHFYRSFAVAPVSISIACWYILHELKSERDPSLISALTFFKLFSDLAVWFIVRSLSSKRAYYYYNMHISAVRLWLTVFFIDLIVFITGIWAVH